MDSFTAIDFETAQGYRHTICRVGLVRVEKGIITHTLDIPVRPPDNYYWYKNTDIHGMDAGHTADSPGFDEVWEQLKPLIEGQEIVAHNMPFDAGCLKATLEYYGLPVPEFQRHCTYNLYGKGLAVCCEEHNIQLDHHNALSDALACAELFKRHLQAKGERNKFPCNNLIFA